MNSLESDLHKSETIIKKIKDDRYAQNLYSALCNNSYKKSEDTESWSCSWRYAGGIIAHMREAGDYLDWYCSGNEGHITEEVRDDLVKLGWRVQDE